MQYVHAENPHNYGFYTPLNEGVINERPLARLILQEDVTTYDGEFSQGTMSLQSFGMTFSRVSFPPCLI